MKELLLDGLTQMGLSPTSRQIEQLEEYARLLLEQNQVMNLTAITEPDQVARLHFLDSASIIAWKGSGSLAHKSVMDVGTGAGFPGVVLKILEPSLKLTLVDSLGKRVAWLEAVCKAISLDEVRCLHARAEELALEPGFRDSFDLAVSRAVASYPLLSELCLPFVRVGGAFVAMKSVESDAEVQSGEKAVKTLGGKALESWDYTIPGTDVIHRLVAAQKTAPTPKGYPRSWGKIKKNPL